MFLRYSPYILYRVPVRVVTSRYNHDCLSIGSGPNRHRNRRGNRHKTTAERNGKCIFHIIGLTPHNTRGNNRVIQNVII